MITDTINFYGVREPYGEFSNFAPFPIEPDGQVWPTSEHYFQAQKFAGTSHAETIRTSKGGQAAARAGRSRMFPMRPDWVRVRDEAMRTALRAKFSQHPKLTALLLATGESLLVEHTSNDAYWGDGGDGSGVNRLGQLLMELRNELRHEARP
jgi:ribA/ribD-fused uncharacterized protein